MHSTNVIMHYCKQAQSVPHNVLNHSLAIRKDIACGEKHDLEPQCISESKNAWRSEGFTIISAARGVSVKPDAGQTDNAL